MYVFITLLLLLFVFFLLLWWVYLFCHTTRNNLFFLIAFELTLQEGCHFEKRMFHASFATVLLYYCVYSHCFMF